MILSFEDYRKRGGQLEETSFDRFNRKAEYLLRSQAAGLTGKRLDKQADLPQAVTDCIFDLVSYLEAETGAGQPSIKSESRSSDGVTESVSYSVKDEKTIRSEMEDIIFEYLNGAGLGTLLFRGLRNDD